MTGDEKTAVRRKGNREYEEDSGCGEFEHGYGSFCGSSSGTGGDDHRVGRELIRRMLSVSWAVM